MFINLMSDEEISDYKEAFKFYDRKNRGYFTVQDFDVVTMGYEDNPTYLKLRSIMKREGYLDRGVDFPVFLYFMCQDRTEHVPLDDPQEAFCSFDKDGDGMISKNDLRHGMRLLDEPLSEEELDKMVETFARFNNKIGFRSWELLPIVRKYGSFKPIISTLRGAEKPRTQLSVLGKEYESLLKALHEVNEALASASGEEYAQKVLGPTNDSIAKIKKHFGEGSKNMPAVMMEDKMGGYKRRKSVASSVIVSPTIEDGYMWRKYGQKDILKYNHPRCYFRCNNKYSQGCEAIKQSQKVEDEGKILYRITYFGCHICSQTRTQILPDFEATVSTTTESESTATELESLMTESESIPDSYFYDSFDE